MFAAFYGKTSIPVFKDGTALTIIPFFRGKVELLEDNKLKMCYVFCFHLLILSLGSLSYFIYLLYTKYVHWENLV